MVINSSTDFEKALGDRYEIIQLPRRNKDGSYGARVKSLKTLSYDGSVYKYGDATARIDKNIITATGETVASLIKVLISLA